MIHTICFLAVIIIGIFNLSVMYKYTKYNIIGIFHYTVEIPVWNTRVIFSFGESIEECEKYCECNLIDTFTQNGTQGTHYAVFNHKVGSLIRMKSIKNQNINFGTLQHEILHATLSILRDKGVKFDLDNQEPFCYLQGYITEKILEKILI